MSLPEINSRQEQSANKYGLMTSILLIITIITIGFAVYLKSQNIDLKHVNIKELIASGLNEDKEIKSAEVLAALRYNSEEGTAFGVFGSYIIECSKDSVKWIDNMGEEQFTKPVTLNNPLVKSAGAYLLIADLGGRDLYVIKGKEIKWSEKLDNAIINADINSKGYVSVVSEMKGYKGSVSVYDGYGSWIFTAARAESHVIAAEVLPSSSRVLVNTVDVSGVTPDSNLEFVDMNGKTAAVFKKENAIFPSTWYINGGLIAAVSDSSIVCLNEDKEVKWEQVFSKIYSSVVCSGKYLVAAVSSDGKSGIFGSGSTLIKLFDTRGQARDIFTVDGKVENLESYDNMIAVNSGRTVYFINTGGDVIAKYQAKMDVKNVRFFNKSEAVVITKNSVDIVKIK